MAETSKPKMIGNKETEKTYIFNDSKLKLNMHNYKLPEIKQIIKSKDNQFKSSSTIEDQNSKTSLFKTKKNPQFPIKWTMETILPNLPFRSLFDPEVHYEFNTLFEDEEEKCLEDDNKRMYHFDELLRYFKVASCVDINNDDARKTKKKKDKAPFPSIQDNPFIIADRTGVYKFNK